MRGHSISSPRASEMLLVFGLLLLPFLTGLSEQLSISHDSIFYRLGVIGGSDVSGYYHPHHILYMPLASAWYRFLQFVGFIAQPHIAAEVLNSIIGAAAGTAIYFLLRSRGQLSIVWSVIGVALSCFSFGFWYHSVCLEVCIPPLFWFVIALIPLTSTAPSSKNAALTGAFHALAILFHQVYVFLGVAMLYSLWRRDEKNGARFRAISAYLATACSITIFVYTFAAFQSVKPFTPNALWLWVTAYAHIGTATESHFYPPSVKTPIRVAIGEARAITPMYAVVKVPRAFAVLKKLLPYKHFDDEVFLYRNASQIKAIIMFIASLAIICGAFILLILSFRKRKRLNDSQRRFTGAMFASIIVFSMFFAVWDSFNVEFWILQTTLLWMAVVTLHGSQNISKETTFLFSSLASLLVAINYFGAILPLSQKNNDFYRLQADVLEKNTNADDLIILDESYPLDLYISSFAPRRMQRPYLDILQGKPADSILLAVRSGIDSTLQHGGKAIIFPYLLQIDARCPMSLDAAAADGREDRLQLKLDSLWAPYKHRFTEEQPDAYVRYYTLKK